MAAAIFFFSLVACADDFRARRRRAPQGFFIIGGFTCGSRGAAEAPRYQGAALSLTPSRGCATRGPALAALLARAVWMAGPLSGGFCPDSFGSKAGLVK